MRYKKQVDDFNNRKVIQEKIDEIICYTMSTAANTPTSSISWG